MTDAPMIWGFDVSKRRTGVAFGHAGEAPHFSSVTASEGETTARAGVRLFVFCKDLNKLAPPDAIYFERRLEHGFKPEVDFDARTIKQHRGIIAAMDIAAMVQIVEVFAGLLSLTAHDVAPSTARKEFLGDGRLPRKAAKLRARAMCSVLGWNAENDDEADAAAIWHWGVVKTAPRLAAPIHGGLHMKAATLAAKRSPAIFAQVSDEVPW